MNLYLLSQSQNSGYDTYDSCVVAAVSEETAKTISPSSWGFSTHGSWAYSPDKVTAELIGAAAPGTEQGVILSSFNAG